MNSVNLDIVSQIYIRHIIVQANHLQYILPENKQFWRIAEDEALFRLEDNKRMNCSCTKHLEEKEELENFLKKLKSRPNS